MTCTIEGCDKPLRSPVAKWCAMHYHRWYRHGDPLATKDRWPGPKLPCRAPHCARLGNRVTGWCKPHYDKVRQWGNPIGRMDLTYGGAHTRVRVTRGSPRTLACEHCGRPATDWAYDHTDPDERTGTHRRPERNGSLIALRWSCDPWRYIPLCRSCHTFFDRPVAAPSITTSVRS